MSGSALATITASDFVGNATGDGARRREWELRTITGRGGDGAAVHTSGTATLSMTGCSITQNNCGDGGEGPSLFGSNGVGMRRSSSERSCAAQLTDCTISDNTGGSSDQISRKHGVRTGTAESGDCFASGDVDLMRCQILRNVGGDAAIVGNEVGYRRHRRYRHRSWPCLDRELPDRRECRRCGLDVPFLQRTRRHPCRHRQRRRRRDHQRWRGARDDRFDDDREERSRGRGSDLGQVLAAGIEGNIHVVVTNSILWNTPYTETSGNLSRSSTPVSPAGSPARATSRAIRTSSAPRTGTSSFVVVPPVSTRETTLP